MKKFQIGFDDEIFEFKSYNTGNSSNIGLRRNDFEDLTTKLDSLKPIRDYDWLINLATKEQQDQFLEKVYEFLGKEVKIYDVHGLRLHRGFITDNAVVRSNRCGKEINFTFQSHHTTRVSIYDFIILLDFPFDHFVEEENVLEDIQGDRVGPPILSPGNPDPNDDWSNHLEFNNETYFLLNQRSYNFTEFSYNYLARNIEGILFGLSDTGVFEFPYDNGNLDQEFIENNPNSYNHGTNVGYIINDSRVKLLLKDTNDNFYIAESEDPIDFNDWTMITWTFDGSADLYVNGQPVNINILKKDFQQVEGTVSFDLIDGNVTSSYDLIDENLSFDLSDEDHQFNLIQDIEAFSAAFTDVSERATLGAGIKYHSFDFPLLRNMREKLFEFISTTNYPNNPNDIYSQEFVHNKSQGDIWKPTYFSRKLLAADVAKYYSWINNG